jgi:hypothetical protein
MKILIRKYKGNKSESVTHLHVLLSSVSLINFTIDITNIEYLFPEMSAKIENNRAKII